MMKYKTNRRISTPPPLLLPNMLRGTAFAVATVVCLFARETACFSSISISQRALSLRRSSPSSSSSSLPISTTVLSATKATPTPTVVKGPRRVAVAGATGRVGRLVVNELLTSYTADGGDGIGATSGTTVIALVRSKTKAEDVFPAALRPANLAVVVCDLSNEQQVTKALQGCQAVVWCASGTTSSSVASAADQSILGKLKSAMGITGAAMKPSNIDTTAFPLLTKALPKPHVVATNVNGSDGKEPVLLPQVVMCSACAVTRPTWSPEKKKLLAGAADIPIVRLNPQGILDLKRQSEELLRQSGTPYCIVRSVGLRDDWPINSRPIFSQGDVAAGRINPKDLARILVQALVTPTATGKTFEVATIQGYPPGAADAMSSALSKLQRDDEVGEVSMDHVLATYSVMQQLLPGETQDTTALVMGQSYEELDAESSAQKKKETVGAV